MNAKRGNIEVCDKDLDTFWARIRDFVVLGITHNYKTTVYQGTHPKFDTLKNGDIIPFYSLGGNYKNKKYELVRVQHPAKKRD